MSDADQSAPPAKRPRLETAQEAYDAACKKYSSCEEHLRKLQESFVKSCERVPIRISWQPFAKTKRKRPKTKTERGRHCNMSENRQSSPRHALLNNVAKVGSA